MVIEVEHNKSEIEDNENIKLFDFSMESSSREFEEPVNWIDFHRSLRNYNLGRIGYNISIDELDMGASSVYSEIIFINEPSISFEEIKYKKYQITQDDIEKDIIFRMPPKRKYTKEFELKSVKKATPNFIEEDFK